MTAEFVTPESETLLKAGRGICRGWLAVVAGTMGSPSGPSTMTILTFGVFVRPISVRPRCGHLMPNAANAAAPTSPTSE
jgi:hypothetical protein